MTRIMIVFCFLVFHTKHSLSRNVILLYNTENCFSERSDTASYVRVIDVSSYGGFVENNNIGQFVNVDENIRVNLTREVCLRGTGRSFKWIKSTNMVTKIFKVDLHETKPYDHVPNSYIFKFSETNWVVLSDKSTTALYSEYLGLIAFNRQNTYNSITQLNSSNGVYEQCYIDFNVCSIQLGRFTCDFQHTTAYFSISEENSSKLAVINKVMSFILILILIM